MKLERLNEILLLEYSRQEIEKMDTFDRLNAAIVILENLIVKSKKQQL